MAMCQGRRSFFTAKRPFLLSLVWRVALAFRSLLIDGRPPVSVANSWPATGQTALEGSTEAGQRREQQQRAGPVKAAAPNSISSPVHRRFTSLCLIYGSWSAPPASFHPERGRTLRWLADAMPATPATIDNKQLHLAAHQQSPSVCVVYRPRA